MNQQVTAHLVVVKTTAWALVALHTAPVRMSRGRPSLLFLIVSQVYLSCSELYT